MGFFNCFIITVSNFININDICKLGHPLVVVVVVGVVVVVFFGGGGGLAITLQCHAFGACSLYTRFVKITLENALGIKNASDGPEKAYY